MSKFRAKTVSARAALQLDVALACDSGTASGGMFGLTDLFTYANDFAVKRRASGSQPLIRITHWRAEDGKASVQCTFDSCPGAVHATNVVVIPNNHRAITVPCPDTPLVPWLRKRHSEGVVLAAVCGGVFILAKTGLLAGREATTHWALSNQFSAQFPDILLKSDRMVIDYGDVLTAGGALAWADLGLCLIERFLGSPVMLDTARYMNVDPPGREQRFYSSFEPRTAHGDGSILKAQQWLLARRDRPATVADMARYATLEPRTFLRRFVRATGMKPTEYQQRLRMSRARELLEFSRSPIERIGSRVGYEDARAFRRVFRQIVGLTPSDYRRRFGRAESAGRPPAAQHVRRHGPQRLSAPPTPAGEDAA